MHLSASLHLIFLSYSSFSWRFPSAITLSPLPDTPPRHKRTPSRLFLPRWRQAMLCDWNLYARRSELNPHNLLSHLTHTQSIHSVIALLWEADVRLPWFSCMCGCVERKERSGSQAGAQYCRQDTGGWLGERCSGAKVFRVTECVYVCTSVCGKVKGIERLMLNDCLSSLCQTQPTAEAEVCRKRMRSLLGARQRCWGGRESLFSCLPAKIGADPLCSKIWIQVKFNPSYRSNPCQSLSQAARLTDLHFQHHDVRLGEERTRKCFHAEQIRRKLLADDTSDSDPLLSDDAIFRSRIFSQQKQFILVVKALTKETISL